MAKLGIQLRFNLRAQRGELSHDGSKTWKPMTDRSTAALRRRIAETFDYKTLTRPPSPLKYGREEWTVASNALLHERECDPFLDYLKALPAWDEFPRLDGWLGDVFTLADKDDPLVPWVGRYIFLGAVWRADRPGAKLDEMPVLIGPPGIGKSTAVEQVLPPAHQKEWFTDGLHLAAPPKVRAEALQGRVIVEVAEMAGATRAEIEELKAFLSRRDDGGTRLAYRRNPEPLPRRAILVGTADHGEPLPNDPNLRRFVPVRLAGGDPARVRAYLDKHREQLWAEARSLYHKGREARLPDHLKGQQAVATEGARQRDLILEEAVAAWAVKQKEPFTLAQCAVGAGIVPDDQLGQISKALQNRLGRALRAQGYETTQTRRNGQRVRFWAGRG